MDSGVRRNDEQKQTVMTDTNTQQPAVDENFLIAERRGKLAALRGQGVAFPNDFKRGDYAGDLQAEYADADAWTAETLEANGRRVAIAGRLLAKRVMGKAAFATVQDMTVKIDGVVVPSALVDTEVPTDPGEHSVEASAPGFLKSATRLSVGEGEKKSVTLTLTRDPNAAVAPVPPSLIAAVILPLNVGLPVSQGDV